MVQRGLIRRQLLTMWITNIFVAACHLAQHEDLRQCGRQAIEERLPVGFFHDEHEIGTDQRRLYHRRRSMFGRLDAKTAQQI